MVGKQDSLFLSEIGGLEKIEFEKSSESIRPLIQDFCTKCIKSKIKFNGQIIGRYMNELIEIAMYFASNTSKGEKIDGEDLKCIKAIMAELEKLYNEIIKSKFPKNEGSYYGKKLALISEIFCKNTVSMERNNEENIHYGKIFERYKDLYLIISLVNNNYDELLEKGVELSTLWYPFFDVVQNRRNEGKPLSEDEKMKYFIALINGSMKFHPVYEHKAVGYTIVQSDYSRVIVNTKSTEYDTGISFPQTDAEFEIEGEGINKKIIRRTK